MAIERREGNVFTPFVDLQREIDRMFDEAFEDFGIRRSTRNGFIPTVNIYETEDAVNIEMEIPGIEKDALDIDLSDGVLTVKGEKKNEREDESKNYHLYERTFGSFNRSFRIPDNVDQNKAKAKYENGILKIELPKKEEAKREAKKLEIE
ncbi:MAG: Hsp20/alpha crystallin family protein [Kosmotogaceae bacterium]